MTSFCQPIKLIMPPFDMVICPWPFLIVNTLLGNMVLAIEPCLFKAMCERATWSSSTNNAKRIYKVDETSVDEIGVDEKAVDKTAVDEPGIIT